MEGNGYVVNDDKTSLYSISTIKTNDKEPDQTIEVNPESIEEIKDIIDALEGKNKNIKI